MSSANYIRLKGTQFYFTTDPDHIVAPPTAVAALPTVYPVAAPDLVAIASVATGWVAFDCVESVSGLGILKPELSEHRCINGTSDIVEKLSTGFMVPETVSMRLTFIQEEFDLFYGLVETRGVIRMLVVPPVRTGHTTPFRMAHRYYVTSSNILFDDLQKPIGHQLELELAFDSGVRTLGAA